MLIVDEEGFCQEVDRSCPHFVNVAVSATDAQLRGGVEAEEFKISSVRRARVSDDAACKGAVIRALVD